MRFLSIFPLCGLAVSIYIYLSTFFSKIYHLLSSNLSIYLIFLFFALMIFEFIRPNLANFSTQQLTRKKNHNKRLSQRFGKLFCALTVILMLSVIINFLYYGKKLGNERVEKTSTAYVLKNRTTTLKEVSEKEYQLYQIQSTRLFYGHYIFLFFYLFQSSCYYKLPRDKKKINQLA